jgi:hypothetical protein
MKDIVYSENKIIFTKHKYYNLQIGVLTEKKEKTNIFNFSIKVTKKVDHAGFSFDFEIFNFYIIFYTYDNRHWCYRCNNWESKNCH